MKQLIMNNWIVLSFIAAVSMAIVNLSTKKVSDNPKLNEYSVAWLRNITPLPFLWLTLLSTKNTVIDYHFWYLLLIMIPLEIVGTLFYFRSIKISPISLVTPISSFSTVFIAIGAFFILGEKLTLAHIIAMILFVVAVYILNLDLSKSRNIFYPLVKITREKGIIFMLASCLVAGLNLPIQKIAIQYTSSQLFPAIYFSLAVIPFTFIFLKNGSGNIKDMLKSSTSILVMGIFNGIYLLAATRAVSFGKIALVNAIVTLNILITIVFAGTFLKEKDLPKRFIVGLIMAVGTILIALNP